MTFVRIKPSRRRCQHSDAHIGPLFASSRCREVADWNYGDEHNRGYGPLCIRHMLERIEWDRRHRMRIDGYGKEPAALCGGCRKCRGLDCIPECDSGCVGKPARKEAGVDKPSWMPQAAISELCRRALAGRTQP